MVLAEALDFFGATLGGEREILAARVTLAAMPASDWPASA